MIARKRVSIIIPAWNEGERLIATVQALYRANREETLYDELIVVDDGSGDGCADHIAPFVHQRVRHPFNRGKGAALLTGFARCAGDIIVFLDADLTESAAHVEALIAPVGRDEADMCIAKLPSAVRKGGFGLVKKLAAYGIYRLSGCELKAPLSGQRAMKREVMESIGGLSHGFGIEVGLTIDAAWRGYRISEVDVPFRHHETGRNLRDFAHRGSQLTDIAAVLVRKWRSRPC